MLNDVFFNLALLGVGVVVFYGLLFFAAFIANKLTKN